MENSFWHVYDIKDIPSPFKQVLTWNGFHFSVESFKPEDWTQGHCDWVEKWCYVADLVSATNDLENKLGESMFLLDQIVAILREVGRDSVADIIVGKMNAIMAKDD